MTKDELRRKFRAIRKAHVASLSPDAHRRDALRVGHRIEEAVEIPDTIAGYAAMASEIDIGPALDSWREAGHAITLPCFETRDGVMSFCHDSGTRAPGPFGVEQPAGTETIRPGIVIVPLVAVDRAGNRLGQGAGHYDRALALLREAGPVTAIGACWDCQIAECLPADDWDQPLDLIVTPSELITPR